LGSLWKGTLLVFRLVKTFFENIKVFRSNTTDLKIWASSNGCFDWLNRFDDLFFFIKSHIESRVPKKLTQHVYDLRSIFFYLLLDKTFFFLIWFWFFDFKWLQKIMIMHIPFLSLDFKREGLRGLQIAQDKIPHAYHLQQ
jgi:hypothetical protein